MSIKTIKTDLRNVLTDVQDLAYDAFEFKAFNPLMVTIQKAIQQADKLDRLGIDSSRKVIMAEGIL